MLRVSRFSGAVGAAALLLSPVGVQAQAMPGAVAAHPAALVNALMQTQIAMLAPMFTNLCFGGSQGCVLPLRPAKPVAVPVPPAAPAAPPIAGGGAAGGVGGGAVAGGGLFGGGLLGIGAMAALAGVIAAAAGSSGNGNDSAGG